MKASTIAMGVVAAFLAVINLCQFEKGPCPLLEGCFVSLEVQNIFFDLIVASGKGEIGLLLPTRTFQLSSQLLRKATEKAVSS